MFVKRLELVTAFIAFTLGLVWIVLLGHIFSELPAAQEYTLMPVDLTPPIGWLGVSLYCAGVALAAVLIPAGACIHVRGATVLGRTLLALGTAGLAAGAGFYAFAGDQFWSFPLVVQVDDTRYIVLSVLAVVFAVVALAAALAGGWQLHAERIQQQSVAPVPGTTV